MTNELEPSSNLLCCFFAQFDNKAGPRISFQAPADFMSTTAFDEISKLIIPKPFLCGSLVSVFRDTYVVVGVPVLLRNTKYHRNALLFNFSFVVRARPGPYEPLLHKVADTLRAMEQESEFVSSGTGLATIEQLCSACLRELNASAGLCEYRLDPGNTVYLKLQRERITSPPLPASHSVPVAVVPLASLETASWDLSILRVAQWIDGVRCIRDIAKEAKADVHLVAQAVRVLIAYKVVCITERPLASNRYACTSKASTFCYSALGQVCCQALGIAPSGLPRVALLYVRMKPSETFVTTLQNCRFPIDNPPFGIERFVMFGLLNDIIRRVQPYLYRKDDPDRAVSLDHYLVQENLPLDERNFEKALKRFEANKDYVIIWK